MTAILLIGASENGVERSAYTLLADILTGIGFALLLIGLPGADRALWPDTREEMHAA